jgi:hypothetical protein
VAPPFLILPLDAGEFFKFMTFYRPFSLGNERGCVPPRAGPDAVVSTLDIFPNERLYSFKFPRYVLHVPKIF